MGDERIIKYNFMAISGYGAFFNFFASSHCSSHAASILLLKTVVKLLRHKKFANITPHSCFSTAHTRKQQTTRWK